MTTDRQEAAAAEAPYDGEPRDSEARHSPGWEYAVRIGVILAALAYQRLIREALESAL